MPEKKSANFATIFSVVAVSFGIHVGGGFATGNQTVNFFVKYGWTAVPFCILAILLINLTFRRSLLIGLLTGARNYKQWADWAYAPYQKVLAPIYDIIVLVITAVAIAASVAGGGALLQSYGIPYVPAVIFFGAIFLVLTIFGSGLLAKASTVMSVIILVALLILIFAGLTAPGAGATLAESMKTSGSANFPNFAFAAGIIPALQYVGYQSYTGPDSMIAYTDYLGDKKAINKYFLMNFVLNAGMLCLSVLLLLAHIPDICTDGVYTTIPIFDIAATLGNSPILKYAYTATLFMAFCSTGAGCCFGIVNRFEGSAFQSMGLTARRALVALLMIAASVFMSLAGLTKVVAIGYGYLGYVSLPILVIPSLFIWSARCRKQEAERQVNDVQQG